MVYTKIIQHLHSYSAVIRLWTFKPEFTIVLHHPLQAANDSRLVVDDEDLMWLKN